LTCTKLGTIWYMRPQLVVLRRKNAVIIFCIWWRTNYFGELFRQGGF